MQKALSFFGGMVSGCDPRERARALGLAICVPLIAIALFLWLWSVSASRVHTSLGAVPGPAQVLTQVKSLLAEHFTERAKEAEFYRRQEERNRKRLIEDPKAEATVFKWTGKPTFVDQIFTSLKTVFTGFVIATLVAVPLGILCGLSRVVQMALNPIIQVFRPVSPLAWLPIVTLIVSATYATADGALFEKSFLISAITVTLCSLWPTLINTAVGVTSVDRDLLNVSRALQLPWRTKVTKIVVPSALPYIFTGMRLSLGVGWMVLIAAEMLAQNPGLGKFVWDEFQNGSQASLSRIIVAVLAIGVTGFLLDRIMLGLQQLVTRR